MPCVTRITVNGKYCSIPLEHSLITCPVSNSLFIVLCSGLVLFVHNQCIEERPNPIANRYIYLTGSRYYPIHGDVELFYWNYHKGYAQMELIPVGCGGYPAHYRRLPSPIKWCIAANKTLRLIY